MDLKEQHVFEAMYERRSIRNYIPDKPVEPKKIKKLLMAAMAAPSACNLQPWEFILVTEPGLLADVRDAPGGGQYNAPMVLIVCGNTSYIPWEGDDGVIDCSAAIENLMLAATVLGLGTVWIGNYDGPALRKLLDIPDHVVPLSAVYVGYPAEQKPPRTQYTEEAIYWQKYDPQREHPPRSTDLRFL